MSFLGQILLAYSFTIFSSMCSEALLFQCINNAVGRPSLITQWSSTIKNIVLCWGEIDILISVQINFLNLLPYYDTSITYYKCLWSLSMKEDPVQWHGILSECAINLSTSVLETKELKLSMRGNSLLNSRFSKKQPLLVNIANTFIVTNVFLL